MQPDKATYSEMRVHFIAIGGAAMHSLAIALHDKGYIVTGSDDEIFGPPLAALAKKGLLPPEPGWFPEKIVKGLDAVILGMHAHRDNPELLRALELGIRIYSFPEFLLQETRDKLRVVIAGSHGKTTITSMVMHVLRYSGIHFDYLVGSQLEGFGNMAGIEQANRIAVFEGDEYLSSCLDPRPKFHVYEPRLSLISGIAWDHVNVFPSREVYVGQFRHFIEQMPADGCLVYCNEDPELARMAASIRPDLKKIPYDSHEYVTKDARTFLKTGGGRVEVQIFGRHNMQNIQGARMVCRYLGVRDEQFYRAIAEFRGAARRLELMGQNSTTSVFTDFAHSPSKVEATIKAVKERNPERRLVACLELHTYSSLNRDFLDHYSQTMDKADEAVVYFDPAVVHHKRLQMITPKDICRAFGNDRLIVITDKKELEDHLRNQNWSRGNLLLMSSGNFSGIDLRELTDCILAEKL